MMCLRECCELKENRHFVKKRGEVRDDTGEKVGIVLLSHGEVIVVQSNNNLWGFPKGGRNDYESELQCGIRELFEETGYVLSLQDAYNSITKVVRIGNRAVYYVVRGEKKELSPGSDASRVGWVKVSCMCEMVEGGNMEVTSHTKVVMKRLWGIQPDKGGKFVEVA